MKNSTSTEIDSKLNTANTAPAEEAVLSRRELDHFFSVYFDIKNISSKIRQIPALPTEITAELEDIDQKYNKIDFEQIDFAGYDTVKELYKAVLELWEKVLKLDPAAAEKNKISEITINDVRDALAVPADSLPKRSMRGNVLIALVILLVFGSIICVTVPLPWVYNTLGNMYFYGRVVDTDYEEAEKWFRKAAESGYAKAQFNLGLCYETGNGVEQDYEAAVKWFRKAAEQNLAKAQYELARCLDEGMGCERNYEEAVKWYKKAADQGHPASQYYTGVYCEKNGDMELAFQWYSKAAAQNYVKAMRNLGYYYEKGKGTPKNQDEAVKWYRAAAEKGDAIAQYNLALYCENKDKNYREAAHWMRKSAKQDNKHAQYNLGRYFEEGKGVKKDIREAIRWYSVAARAEQHSAIEALKRLGLDIQQDNE